MTPVASRATRRDTRVLVAIMAGTFAAALVGGMASANASSFYAQLDKPAWAPPAWLFGPVWTVLYMTMAVAAWMAWKAGAPTATRSALAWYGLQLVANAAWTWCFFALRMGGLATAEILLLLALIVMTMLAFARLRPLAGALLIPYLLWVTYATALTIAVWRMNPGLL